MKGISIAINHQQGHFSLNLDIQLPSEGLSVIFGPSGCGKTTLLRCLAGLEKPADAALRFNGEVWQQGRTFVAPQHRKVAMVFQHNNLLPHLTAQENIEYAIKRRKQQGQSLNELLEWLDLSTLKNRYPDSLSGGEQQRVALARALASAPRLLLMDEPFSALDEERKQPLLGYLNQIKHRLPIIYVTHARQEMMRLADQVLVMSQGAVVEQGVFWEVMKSRPNVVLGVHAKWSVWTGRVLAKDSNCTLGQIETAAGIVWVTRISEQVGTDVRLLFNASDVSISLSKPLDSSILNVLPAQVSTVLTYNESQSVVILNTQAGVLRALLTQKSIQQLDLKVGMAVYAQIKSVAMWV